MASFAGEPFVTAALPDYETERTLVVLYLIVSSVLWIFVVPLLLLLLFPTTKDSSTGAASSTIQTTTRTQRGHKKKSIVKTKKTIVVSKSDTKKNGHISPSTTTPTTTVTSFPAATGSAVGGVLTAVAILLLYNPHNYYTSRRVFAAPLLHESECQTILDYAAQAAAANAQQYSSALNEQQQDKNSSTLLDPPVGWQKTRHSSYPTTDLNLVTDPFSSDARTYISRLLDRRLSPLMSRLYGIPIASIRANDMFVVRYDAHNDDTNHPYARQFLRNHTDESDISFNILLNRNFTGGGTRFWNRHRGTPFAHVQPTQAGSVLLHSALINHEGYTISQGSRFILVGFLSVDRIDPFTKRHTGLSALASWWSLPHMHRKFKAAFLQATTRVQKKKKTLETNTNKWTDSKYVRSLFLDLWGVMNFVSDYLHQHQAVQVVPDASKVAFLAALDDAPPSLSNASWFAGQLINLELDGSYAGAQSTRRDHQDKFDDL